MAAGLRGLARAGQPTRETYMAVAGKLLAWRVRHADPGLWPRAPRMLTATLDDGWGHGIGIIQALAEAVGVEVHPLGTCQPAELVVRACADLQPDLLGISVLHFDSDEAVRHIVRRLPIMTTMVAGGAAYRYDPDFAQRTGTHFTARDGRAFLSFLMAFRPHRRE